MTRTQRNHSPPSGGGKNISNIAQRRSQVSRSLSKVLRHQAENERIPITREGWARVSDLLAWRGLSDPSRFGPPVTVSEIMDVVQDDGINGKGRFALKLVKGDKEPVVPEGGGTVQVDGAATGEMLKAAQQPSMTENTDAGSDSIQFTMQENSMKLSTALDEAPLTSSKNSPETLATIRYQSENTDAPATAFLIRATQGHSIKTIESEGLLTPITLEDPSSLPVTVVHGTFYGAWKSILSTGGLKPMRRNMVHFASGPVLSEVLPSTNADANADPNQSAFSMKSKQDVDSVLSRNKVISGMRWDAQILIYIDIKRLLQDVRDQGWEMKWWRSDNGVILTEGVTIPLHKSAQEQEPVLSSSQATDQTGNLETGTTLSPEHAVSNEDQNEAKKPTKSNAKAQRKPQAGKAEKVVPLAYFDAAVEIKAGVGILWRAGEGMINELPEHLSSKSLPRGKAPRNNKGSEGRTGRVGRQDKPRVRVERDTDLDVDIGDGAD